MLSPEYKKKSEENEVALNCEGNFECYEALLLCFSPLNIKCHHLRVTKSKRLQAEMFGVWGKKKRKKKTA